MYWKHTRFQMGVVELPSRTVFQAVTSCVSFIGGTHKADLRAAAANSHFVRDLSIRARPEYALAANGRIAGCNCSIWTSQWTAALGRW